MAPRRRLALAALGAAALLRSDARAPRALRRGEVSTERTLPPVEMEFRDGERLTYAIGWSSGGLDVFVPAGRGVVEVKHLPGDLIELRMSASSNRIFDLIYRLRHEARSLVDARRGHSVLFEVDQDERGRTSWERVVFDYCSLAARTVERSSDGRLGRGRRSIEGPVLDTLSCLYYIRAARLAPGKAFALPVFQHGKLWELGFVPGEPEEMKLGRLGRFRALRVRPEMRFPGLFERQGEYVVWVEERTGIILKAVGRLPVGSVELRLTAAEKSALFGAE